MNEMLDIFDANYNNIGILDRISVHQQGIWHQTFHCWIVGQRDGHPFVILQLRSASKKNYPNMLDISAAGHLEAGEAPLDGIRELEEELGVKTSMTNLRRLGIKHDISDEPNGMRNREFAHVFMVRDDREIEAYKLQENEVSGLVEVPLAGGLALFSEECKSLECKATRIEDGKCKSFTKVIFATDLIRRVDSYYLKVFIMAQRMLNNEPYLSI